ncbi:MAG: SigE family RNA polymerase sigma factor [Nocardioidaceae bacterium]
MRPRVTMTTITTCTLGPAATMPLGESWSAPAVPHDGQRTGAGQVRDDERAAFDAFVRARLPELLRFGRALTGSPEAAADLVQDALERTLLSWSRLESRHEPEGYVRRIMVNRNISIWRKFGRERPTDVITDRGTEDQHFDSDLWQAIQQLPTKQRAVIALRYYDDMSEAEIARTLGCSVGTVKSQASKALDKLRRLVPQDI